MLLLSPIIAFPLVAAATLVDFMRPSSPPADATHVPTFYVPVPFVRPFELHLFPSFLSLYILGTLFGGIHCVGWYLPFPTYAYQKLWRIASVVVTISPFLPFAAVVIISPVYIFVRTRTRTNDPTFNRIQNNLSSILRPDHHHKYISIPLTIFLIMYISARLLLLGLALALLRHQPPNVFITVDWTRFFPHIY